MDDIGKERSNYPRLGDDAPRSELSDVGTGSVSKRGPIERASSFSTESVIRRETVNTIVENILQDDPPDEISNLIEELLFTEDDCDKWETYDFLSHDGDLEEMHWQQTRVHLCDLLIDLYSRLPKYLWREPSFTISAIEEALENCFTDPYSELEKRYDQLKQKQLLNQIQEIKMKVGRLTKAKAMKRNFVKKISILSTLNKSIELSNQELELEETGKSRATLTKERIRLALEEPGNFKTQTGLKKTSKIAQAQPEGKQKKRKLHSESLEDADRAKMTAKDLTTDQTHDTNERKPVSSEIKDKIKEPKKAPAKDEEDFNENNSAEVKELNVHEFACVINDKIGRIAAVKPHATPHEIVAEAVTQVVLQDVDDEEFSCVDIYDGNKRSVTMCCGAQKVCWIAGNALMQLVPTTETFSSGAGGFRMYLEHKVNEVHNSASELSEAESADVDGDNSSGSENGRLHDVPREKRFQFPYRIPKNKIRFKGVPWIDSDGSDQERNYDYGGKRYNAQSKFQSALEKIKEKKKRSAEKYISRLNHRRPLHVTSTPKCGNKAGKGGKKLTGGKP